MTTLAEHSQALQEVLAELTVLTVQQIVELFRRFQDSPDVLAVLQAAFPEVIDQYTTAAGMVTAQWYDELAPTVDYQADPIIDISPERIDKTIRWSLYAPGESTPVERLSGSAKRMVFDASRTTVIGNADAEGVKWARYASATACEFCKVLATRGAVYATKTGALKGHDHCRCVAVAERGGQTYAPPPYVQSWEDEYNAARDAVKAAGKAQSLKNILAAMRANQTA